MKIHFKDSKASPRKVLDDGTVISMQEATSTSALANPQVSVTIVEINPDQASQSGIDVVPQIVQTVQTVQSEEPMDTVNPTIIMTQPNGTADNANVSQDETLVSLQDISQEISAQEVAQDTEPNAEVQGILNEIEAKAEGVAEVVLQTAQPVQ